MCKCDRSFSGKGQYEVWNLDRDFEESYFSSACNRGNVPVVGLSGRKNPGRRTVCAEGTALAETL